MRDGREHNAEHAAEFRAWAEKVDVARAEIFAEYLEYANEALDTVLEKLGGPLLAAHHH